MVSINNLDNDDNTRSRKKRKFTFISEATQYYIVTTMKL